MSRSTGWARACAHIRWTAAETAQADIPIFARELIGPYLDSAARLGQRTAELHVALANVRGNPDFTPEPFSLEYRRSRYESMAD